MQSGGRTQVRPQRPGPWAGRRGWGERERRGPFSDGESQGPGQQDSAQAQRTAAVPPWLTARPAPTARPMGKQIGVGTSLPKEELVVLERVR